MSAPENRFKIAITGTTRPLIGIWSMLNSTNAVEALGDSGYDWILLDGEHSPLELDDAIAQLRALALSKSIPIVRLPDNDPILLKRFLDAGATTIILPYVQNAEEAQAAVTAMHYPPMGQRGVALMHRASRYTRTKDYLKTASDSVSLIVQLETPVALDNLESIASVKGVDAVFIGPSDLSATMGLLAEPDHPKVLQLIGETLERARKIGIPIGIFAGTPVAAERYLNMGFGFVSVASDFGLLVQHADATAARFREIALAREKAASAA
jgi:4-hydroxy-2-oxoheptanedioate aldolase